MKIDKSKVTSVAGVRKTLFDKQVGHMDKYADKILGENFILNRWKLGALYRLNLKRKIEQSQNHAIISYSYCVLAAERKRANKEGSKTKSFVEDLEQMAGL